MILNIGKNKPTRVKQVQKESVITNTDTFIFASFNTYLLMIKNHFRSSSFYLGNVFIPFIVTFSVGIYFPIAYGFSWMMFLSMTFAGLTTYGTLFFTIRKSTMIKNIQMTANDTSTLYFATFWVILTSLFVTLLFIIATIAILEVSGIVNYAFFYNNINLVDPVETPMDWANYWVINYKEVWWTMIIYYWITQSFLCFSMGFLIEKVATTQKNFFIIVLVYMVGGLIFAGIFCNSLDVNSSGEIVIFDKSVVGKGETSEGRAYQLLWGEPMWWVSQLWPHYTLNQIAGNSLYVGAHHFVPLGMSSNDIISNMAETNVLSDKDLVYWNQWHSVSILESIISPEAVYYMVAPWVWCVLMITVAGILERHDR